MCCAEIGTYGQNTVKIILYGGTVLYGLIP